MTPVQRNNSMTPGKSDGEKKTKVYPTVIAASIFVFFLSMPHVFFMIYVPAIPLLIWMMVNLARAIRDPKTRKIRLARIAIWIVAIGFVCGIHRVMYVITRSYADEVIVKIDQFSKTHGYCPETLEDMGIDRQQFKEALGFASYSCQDGNPSLYYAATFIIYDTYSYDFEQSIWEYRD
ncbi:MAG: hypothetical protein LBS40_02115 [Burkholderiales bacterium]|jgi:hypothetical protein|nr:hypothetical protein [Burkholderiales bacterium]